MLKYLTHKLRNQSLNESEAFNTQTDDDHDSGTESDDEGADIEELQKYMESIIHLESKGNRSLRKSKNASEVTESNNHVCPYNKRRNQHSRASRIELESPLPEPALDSALPSDSDHNFDHHSSEEELEVINSSSVVHHRERITSHPEKRKWSQANHHLSLGEYSGGSSDEEVRDLMCLSAPVEFRTSPPANVHKPSKCLSPPPKVFHSSVANIPPHELCSVSPRKRHRRTPTAVAGGPIQRPCLDFEKMQQINRVRLL